MTAMGTVGVLLGGVSAEREVSLASGRAVAAALRRRGHCVVEIDAGPDLAEILGRKGMDAAFLALHGGWGENGGVQGLLEVIGLPYTGSGVLASALAMDKVIARTIFSSVELAVSPAVVYSGGVVDTLPPFDPPWVVKPAAEGSSIGVRIVRDPEELPTAVTAADGDGGTVLVEEFIAGVEIQVGILDDRVLGSVEVRPHGEFYDFKAKYTPGMTDYILPPQVDAAVLERCHEAGLLAHRALGCRGVSRVDLRVPADGIPRVLEVNTLPGMTETSLLPKIAAYAGITFDALVESILATART